MYIDLKLFVKAEYLTFFRSPFRLRRWAYTAFFTVLFWVMWILVALGRAMDHLFFPGFRKQPVREPVFIIAPPRSGTTLTQKLMSLDTDRFVHNKLYQTIFPAVSWQKFFHGIVWADQHTGRVLERVIGWAARKWFGGWGDLHWLRV